MTTIELPSLFKKIPERLEDSEVLIFLGNERITYKHFRALKTVSKFPDHRISSLLEVSEKTFRSYKSDALFEIKKSTKERALQLLTLFKHGNEVFGDVESFTSWLNKENFILDGETPASYLDSSTGINFIDDKLTAMEYGDIV